MKEENRNELNLNWELEPRGLAKPTAFQDWLVERGYALDEEYRLDAILEAYGDYLKTERSTNDELEDSASQGLLWEPSL